MFVGLMTVSGIVLASMQFVQAENQPTDNRAITANRDKQDTEERDEKPVPEFEAIRALAHACNEFRV